MKRENIIAHLCIAGACASWGLMAPLGKDAMTHGLTGLDMVTFRVTGAAVCFWIASAIGRLTGTLREDVPPRDLLRFFFVSLFSIVLNQCCYTIGLSLTAPTNASIMTTTMPIITMVLAAVVLHEPITAHKIIGIVAGVTGALILINSSTQVTGATGEGNLAGDLLCIGAQCSFAIYLTFFKHVVVRYNAITVMKWTFTYAALVIVPFTHTHVLALPWADIEPRVWWDTSFVVVMGTFVAYIMMMQAQKILRPTVVSIYNYVQPTVACLVSVAAGVGVFGWSQAQAVVLVFTGVWLVTISKSKKDLRKERSRNETKDAISQE